MEDRKQEKMNKILKKRHGKCRNIKQRKMKKESKLEKTAKYKRIRK